VQTYMRDNAKWRRATYPSFLCNSETRNRGKFTTVNPANTITRDFPIRRGKDSTTCFPALFGNCMAKPTYFTSGIVHDVTRANSPRRQLPQFMPILFSSIRPPKRGLSVTDPHRPFLYTLSFDILVITCRTCICVIVAQKVHETLQSVNRARFAVPTEIHRSFMRVKISYAKVMAA